MAALKREAKREKLARRKIGASGRLAAMFLESKLTPLLVVASLLIGVLALVVTPREEEPQIKVPMVDVSIGLPGATAQEVKTQSNQSAGKSVVRNLRTSSTFTRHRNPPAA